MEKIPDFRQLLCHTVHADDFQRFLEVKVQTVRSSTAVYATAAATRSALADPVWREVTEDEVRRTVMTAPDKSCSLDPIPTFLL